MSHYSDEQIHAYILDDMTEAARPSLEEHVFSCDLCLQSYMKWIGINEQHLPGTPDQSNMIFDDSFTEVIMKRIAGQGQAPSYDSPANLAEEDLAPLPASPSLAPIRHLKPFVHYVIAASITLLLVSTGVFHGMTGLASTISDTPKQETTSVTENIMDRALQWFDFKHVRLKEDK